MGGVGEGAGGVDVEPGFCGGVGGVLAGLRLRLSVGGGAAGGGLAVGGESCGRGGGGHGGWLGKGLGSG